MKLKAISSADAVTLPPDPKGQQDAISVRDRLLESKHAAHRKDETSSAADGGGILESEFLPLLPDSARIAGDVVVPAPELKPEPAAGPAEDNPLQSIPPARKRELMSEMIDDDETSKQSVMDISRMLDETSDVDTPRSPRRPHRPTGRPMSREPDRTDERQGRQEGMYKASGEKAKPRKGQSGERGAVKRSEGTGGPLPKVKNIEELEGRQLLRFEVGRIVARGRIGVVFRARDLENDLSVALKILHPGVMKDESEARRFVRAVNTMIGIRHENLVTLYSAGKSGPFCWMASEYVEGENLEEVIGRVGIGGMLPWEQPLRIMTHVARALEVAHRHKIVHRNVTPRSILIRISDGAAKLGDLMLAKATSGTRAEQVTQAGETIGELSYLSPEQAGTGEALDGRTDIYNLGATIYAVLTGQPPIEGENLAQTLIKIQTVLPESPSKQNTSLPPEFERIVMRTLAKSPEDRYETSTALLADLKAVKNRYRVKFRQ